jgi:hypothetical protein
MHPYHFWQLADSELVPLENSCDDLLFEEDWQNSDAMSRAALRQAIDVAERKLRDWLRYDVAPRYHDTVVDWPRRVNQTQWRYADVSAIDRSIGLQLPYKHVRSVGSLTRTSIGDAAVALADANNDGLIDTFTATIATTVTDTSQITAYFASADRWDDQAPLDAWQIRPISVSISGGQATIRGNVWQIVRPELYADLTSRRYYDPADTTIYADSLTIYREYINPDGLTVDDCQSTLLWETNPWPYWCFGSGATYTPNASDPAAIGKAIARCGIRDAANGIVTPDSAIYDSAAGEWRRVWWQAGYEPDRVQVRYLAGLPLVNNQMDRTWQEFVTYLALAELEGPICACESVRARLHHWQFDLARTSGANDEAYAISTADLDNPFGTRRGHIHVWRRVKDNQQLTGYAF